MLRGKSVLSMSNRQKEGKRLTRFFVKANMVIDLLSEMQAALLRENNAGFLEFAQMVDKTKLEMVVAKTFLTRDVLARTAVELVSSENRTQALIALEALGQHNFWKTELKKSGEDDY